MLTHGRCPHDGGKAADGIQQQTEARQQGVDDGDADDANRESGQLKGRGGRLIYLSAPPHGDSARLLLRWADKPTIDRKGSEPMQSRSPNSLPGGAALAACVRPIDDEGGDSATTGATSTQDGAVVGRAPGTGRGSGDEARSRPRRAQVVRFPERRAGRHAVGRRGNDRMADPDRVVPDRAGGVEPGMGSAGGRMGQGREAGAARRPGQPTRTGAAGVRPTRSIHGTNEPQSIGKAVSHGSIRMRNEDIVRLARQVMEAGGAQKDSSFFVQVRRNRSTKEVVDLPTPVPITIR